ncbi:MAG: bifunctional precorrin-2 dehydrogenase/sirohydrochlorin ferrochelatase [Candidatus Omnitrophica bacterium]|nr:bifunctional precorrin-2 dehydrogenase/sirohydrochlorin ferrochelatase [Candidatus Omnitrophota bacterium]
MKYYPAFLKLQGKKVLLFGGGGVALRKARTLIKAGAKLLVISHDCSKAFKRFARANKIDIRFGSQIPQGENPELVVAATSDEALNRTIFEWCEKKGIFVNVVDDPTHSTFIVPSIIQRGKLQIAISTGGASPLLAKTLRKKLEKEFGSKYSALVQKLSKDRMKTKQSLNAPEARRNHFKKVVASEFKLLETGK